VGVDALGVVGAVAFGFVGGVAGGGFCAARRAAY
jgi:hypothetical protein